MKLAGHIHDEAHNLAETLGLTDSEWARGLITDEIKRNRVLHDNMVTERQPHGEQHKPKAKAATLSKEDAPQNQGQSSRKQLTPEELKQKRKHERGKQPREEHDLFEIRLEKAKAATQTASSTG